MCDELVLHCIRLLALATPWNSPRHRINLAAGLDCGFNHISASENCEKQTSAIQKIRQLQENELQCIMDTGTYVQCCQCDKWRWRGSESLPL